jgi:predicted carbohydrate-binding protein with CBM5 and CBM33 domain
VIAVRTIMAVGLVGLATTVPAVPAHAHGAMANPISRTVACGPEGGRYAQSKACRAAKALSDAQALRAWDNLRVPGVAGRDRQKIPDGRLCSGGLDAYKGLDIARTDWPATRLTSGARFTFRYRETIPHQGTFKLYVTKNGYDPSRRLRWSDLESRPFAAVKDPPIRSGSYILKARLPRGKSGRHMIYTIWQNSGSPDTYYSCSDVVFRARKADRVVSPRPSDSAAAAPDPGQSDAAGGSGTTTITPVKRSNAMPLVAAGGGVALLLFGGTALFVIVRRLRRL